MKIVFKHRKKIAKVLIFSLFLALFINDAKVFAKEKSTLIERMSKIDYVSDSITTESGRLSLKKLNKELKKHKAKKMTIGPSFSEYQWIMGYLWEDYTQYDVTPAAISFDVSKRLSYEEYEQLLFDLSTHDGVYLYKIGESPEGKNIYSIEIDYPGNEDKTVLMYSSLVHSREQGSAMMLLAELVDFVEGIENDVDIMELAMANKIVAVPMVELDVSNTMKENDKKYKTKGGMYYKCNSELTDINCNFPSLIAGYKRNDNRLSSYYRDYPDAWGYAGDYLGSSPEVSALMKWMYHYIVVEHAALYMDWHQQGRELYSGMYFASKEQNEINNYFGELVCDYTGYYLDPNLNKYAKDRFAGTNGCSNDYAFSIALGKYSPRLGSYVFWDGEEEILASDVLTVDKARKKGYDLQTVNEDFICCTIEISKGLNVLGGTKAAYKANAKEYKKNIKGLLTQTIYYIYEILGN